MTNHLTDQSRRVLVLADVAARNLNHDYVGTEHILLALVQEPSAGVADVLTTFSIDADKIRIEIAKLVTPGASRAKVRSIPLTPRAKTAVAIAHDEARFMSEHCVSPEHLFLGLMNDPAGVACKVLLNLGIKPRDLTKEVFKVRIAEMKIIERAIRPVRASTPVKRKMREELSAHLAAIYEQESARLHDTGEALEAASKRFGEPSELASELQASLPRHERLSYFIEQFFAYRAPESAAIFSYRMAVHTFVLLAVVLFTATFGVFLRYGWVDEVKVSLRVMTTIALVTPFAQYVIWLAYIKIRDALWGAFGSRKSLVRVFTLGILTTATAAAYLATVTLATRMSVSSVLHATGTIVWMSIAGTIALVTLARLSGTSEIRDTLWALLDLKEDSSSATGDRPSAELT
jgi:hypothetical protein